MSRERGETRKDPDVGTETRKTSEESDGSMTWEDLKRSLDKAPVEAPPVRRSSQRPTGDDTRGVASDSLQRCEKGKRGAK